MRVLPSVFGFTRSRSRNSATPSSNERSSSSYTSAVDGRALDRPEAVAREEVDLEREHEQAAQAERARGLEQPLDDRRADPVAPPGGIDRDGAQLAEVLPHHVQGAAADDRPRRLGDPELLHVLVERDERLAEQDPGGLVARDERSGSPPRPPSAPAAPRRPSGQGR